MSDALFQHHHDACTFFIQVGFLVPYNAVIRFMSCEEYSDAELDLMKKAFRGEPLKPKTFGDRSSKKIQPIFRHPLPVSDRRYDHERVLRSIKSHAADKQVLSAVTAQNAWVLEEVLLVTLRIYSCRMIVLNRMARR
jgi:hypothetical protein